MKNLEQCRKEIDIIDQELITLFEKRMKISREVVNFKLQHNLQIFQPAREQLVIDKSVELIEERALKPYGATFIQMLMNISKSYQSTFIPLEDRVMHKKSKKNTMIVGYPGVAGAFSQQSMYTYFGKVASKSYEKFDDVFEALKKQEIDYGIVPIENSSTGAINDTYDLVREYGFYIVGEQSIAISHHLLGLPDSTTADIKEVYSHTQAIQQSSKFLKRHPYMNPREYTNTAAAAMHIKQQKDVTKAAIASKEAASIYGLKVLQEHIENQSHNHTRFIIVGRNLETNEAANHVSIVFTLHHQTGALFNIVRAIKQYHINISRIESRPMENKPWEYYFYIDFEGNVEDSNVQYAIAEMKKSCLTLRVLGNYQQKSEWL